MGEAFRAFIGSKMVLGTYGIATMYVFADAYDKTKKTYNVSVNKMEVMNTIIFFHKNIITGLITSLYLLIPSVSHKITFAC